MWIIFITDSHHTAGTSARNLEGVQRCVDWALPMPCSYNSSPTERKEDTSGSAHHEEILRIINNFARVGGRGSLSQGSGAIPPKDAHSKDLSPFE